MQDENENLMDMRENITSNPRIAEGVRTIGDIIDARLSRRSVLAGAAATAALTLAGCGRGDEPTAETEALGASHHTGEVSFSEITRGVDENAIAPSDYVIDKVLRWGDAVFPDAPEFDPHNLNAAAQERQFGYNNDFIGFHELEADESGVQRGLLCVNHEFTSTPLMFSGIMERGRLSQEEAEVEIAAHGGTIVEIEKAEDGAWKPVVSSKYNRRITSSTEMALSGPAAGSERLKTPQDPTGRQVFGTFNNCAGGMTPWGTYLMAEENFNHYFQGPVPEDHAEAGNYKRYGISKGPYQWAQYFERFDLSKTPNEPNKFGWVVEVDILDPTSIPKKRTAMGRFKHEGAESVTAPNGKVVVYMGDDQVFDYVYKFVSAKAVDPNNRAANLDLLDEGTLHVGKFEENGDLIWMPLTFGEGPLVPDNGFHSQADVLIETRRAADLLGATPLDRPEDVEPNPISGRVYLSMTNNRDRRPDEVNAVCTRAHNAFGQLIEITEPDGDFTSTKSRWDILVQCGDPADPSHGATWHAATSENGWFGSPDNCAIDPSGRLWVATDGNDKTGANDGFWMLSTDGEERGTSRAFFRAPQGAEVTGPRFTNDGKTLFISVQHPGDGRGATFDNPVNRWPDFKEDMPPRPTVVAIRRKDGGLIGG